MKVTQISIGRFHHFHLARQLEKFQILDKIYTGYPRFQLRDETGISKDKIATFPWLHAPYMKRSKFGLEKFKRLEKEWQWAACNSLDKYVSFCLKAPTILIALSSSGLNAGKKNQKMGGVYICDRGSSHIRFQDDILREEYKLLKLDYFQIDKRIIDKEEKEYEQADIITVPSEFVKKSFEQKGVPTSKLRKINYGARLERFQKVADAPDDVFRILWVGSVSVRKGFLYALHAFQQFQHKNKEFLVIGVVTDEMKKLLHRENKEKVRFLGNIPNNQLPYHYSTSHVFVLPSLEEGLAMVQGEALACGCIVIGSTNSGAEDILTDGVDGFIVNIRSEKMILEKFKLLADDAYLRREMSANAILKTQKILTWDNYGKSMLSLIKSL